MKQLIKFRKFMPSDIDRIMEIERSSFPLDAFSKKRFNGIYKSRFSHFIVALAANKVCGYVVTNNKRQVASLDSVAVDKKYRQQGIGSILINLALKKSKLQGLKRASLEVRTNNEKAVAFHKKMGFLVKKTLKNYYRDGGDAYLMEKSLI